MWGNYHSCTLSSNCWHDGGFRVCAKADYTPEFLNSLELTVDPNPEAVKDFDDFAFHIYLLGHNAVAKHRVRFERLGDSMQFKIVWAGMIAQAGNDEFKHEFSAIVSTAEFSKLQSKNA